MEALPDVAETSTGGVVGGEAGTTGGGGGEAGTTGGDGVDHGPVPWPLVADTVNVYVVPFVSPTTVQSRDVVAVQVLPVGVLMTLYLVIGVPLAGGADQETWTNACPLVTLTPVGAPGTLTGSTVFDAVDVGPVPAAF